MQQGIRKNFSQQKVRPNLLASAFPYCRLGHCVVGSERILRILSLHSPLASAGFLP